MKASPPIRQLPRAGCERVATNDAAVMVVEAGQTGKLHTSGLVGCTAVGGYLLTAHGEALLGLSHRSVGTDTGPFENDPHCLSAQFMYLLSRCSYRYGNLCAAEIVVASMLMEPGRHYPSYNNQAIVQETAAVTAHLRELGIINVSPVTYQTPVSFFTGHSMEVAMTESGPSVNLRGPTASGPALCHVETVVHTTGQA